MTADRQGRPPQPARPEALDVVFTTIRTTDELSGDTW